ncbi:hypothetical protein M0804_010708 [Polistes exclamans]|nr:hypothetical protein M0804_010708 [Polistes exclamans]
MLKSIIFICIIIQCLINCSLVLCNEDNITYSERNINNDSESGSKKNDEFNESMDQDTHDDDLNQVEDFIDPHSFFYDRNIKKVIIEDTVISPSIDTRLSMSDKISNQEEVLKKSIEECQRLKIYYMRLIKMLLINSNLKMGMDDLVEGHLLIKGTKMQIEKLRNVEIEDYSLKEIDLILSEILLEPSLADVVLDTINFNWSIQSVFNFVNSYTDVIIVASGTLFTIILCRTMPYHRMIFFTLVIGFSVSYTMTYLKLLKDAEFKFVATQVKYTEMPAICRPHEMSALERISSHFFGGNNDCEKYYEARMSNPNLEVTPALVLSELFTTVILKPVPKVGQVMSEFISGLTSDLPWVSGLVMKPLLVILLPILMVIGIIFLRVKSFEFGFFRGLSCSFSAPSTNALPQDDVQKRQTIELIREVFAELPANIPRRITTNNDLPNASQVKENDSPADNATEKPCKLMPDKSLNELNSAGGDTDLNNLLSKESEKKTCKCEKSFEINKEIGGGDA